MRCPECGNEMAPDALFCPECGANPNRHQVQRQGCRWMSLVWVGVALLLTVALLGVAAWQGWVQGKRLWQSNAQATADAEFARCQAFLGEEKWALAMAACRQANSLQPGYPGAQEGYATAVVALTPTPTLIPTPTAERSVEEIFTQAEMHLSEQDWDAALERLNELWTVNPEYQRERVSEMRHTALVAQGREALNEGRLEEAIFYLDQAADIKSLEPDLEAERQLAARYVNALTYCGVDWEACTTRLRALYADYPSYRDVFERLVNAYVTWAEAMAAIQEWCPAEVGYGQAVQLRPDAELEARRADAAERCLLATPTPLPGQITGTVTVTVEGFSVGRLAYAAYNADLGVYDVYNISAYDQRLSRVAGNAGQPNWRRDGSLLVYRGVAGLQAVSSAGGVPATLVGDPAAFWPSWSPDGARVAYARQEAEGWRIYVAPVDGAAEPQPVTWGKYPLWGPQGALAFNSCSVDGTVRGVCVVDPNDPSGTPVPLTADPQDIPTGWSPDGGNIAYMSDHAGDWDVYLVSTAGGVAVLTQDDEAPAIDGLPVWAPDGSGLAFISNRGGVWGLYLMAPNGSNVRLLLEMGPLHPNWQLERLSWGP